MTDHILPTVIDITAILADIDTGITRNEKKAPLSQSSWFNPQEGFYVTYDTKLIEECGVIEFPTFKDVYAKLDDGFELPNTVSNEPVFCMCFEGTEDEPHFYLTNEAEDLILDIQGFNYTDDYPCAYWKVQNGGMPEDIKPDTIEMALRDFYAACTKVYAELLTSCS